MCAIHQVFMASYLNTSVISEEKCCKACVQVQHSLSTWQLIVKASTFNTTLLLLNSGMVISFIYFATIIKDKEPSDQWFNNCNFRPETRGEVTVINHFVTHSIVLLPDEEKQDRSLPPSPVNPWRLQLSTVQFHVSWTCSSCNSSPDSWSSYISQFSSCH